MEKFDFKKVFRDLYAPGSKAFTIVDVPRMNFLAVDGVGNPNTATGYGEAVEALFAVSYAVKFDSKRTLGKDYVVGPLEGLWWAEDHRAFTTRDKDAWKWTMLIAQPDWVTPDMVERGRAAKDLPGVGRLRWVEREEGMCVQILHIGSYDDEAPVLARLHGEFMPAHSLTFNGEHHEIYLSDPRRTPAEKLRTVLRQPVRPA